MTYEVARRLVSRGHSVEWFSATFAGAAESELIEGIRIIRSGRQWTVHWQAFRRYRHRLQEDFDVAIDQVNTMPFFTPLWTQIPKFMFIHQLAREVWWYESPLPLSALGYLAETYYLRPYRRTPVLTISLSTQRDLRRIGFSGPITIVPLGIKAVSMNASQQHDEPTFLYVGRLTPSKRVGDIIKAFRIFTDSVPKARLWLIGEGASAHIVTLKRLVAGLRLEKSIDFLGTVSDGEKFRRMASAYALLMASVREGWGLVVSEANSCGTPAIVYDVPGLRDSVIDGQTGLTVKADPQAMANQMIRLWKNPAQREQLSEGGKLFSQTLSFDKTAAIVEASLATLITAGGAPGPRVTYSTGAN